MMENTNIVTAEQQTPNTISASNAIFNVQALTQLQSVAGLMAQAAVTVPEHLRGNPADCMAIIMQAMQWGMNPTPWRKRRTWLTVSGIRSATG